MKGISIDSIIILPHLFEPVCHGELIFVDIIPSETTNGLSYRQDNGKLMLYPSTEEDHKNARYIKPIFISRHEPIKIGDNYTTTYPNCLSAIHTCHAIDGNKIVELLDGKVDIFGGKVIHNVTKEFAFKIIALPQHFSPKALEDIVDGKLKLKHGYNIHCTHEKTLNDKFTYNILLNEQNHITIEQSPIQ